MDYLRPASVGEALATLADWGESATIIAGGTDLLTDFKVRNVRPARLLNINALGELRHIEGNGVGLRLGALTSVQAIAEDRMLREHYAALSDAAARFASLQVRNLATVGGSLGRASPGGDMAPPLLALGARVIVAGADGTRREIPLDAFFLGPRRTALRPGDLMTEVVVDPLPVRTGTSYQRMSYRDVLDLSIVGVAACVSLDEAGRVGGVRVALGSVAPRPIRAPRTEALLSGQPLVDELIDEAGRVAAGEATPIDDQRASAAYRTRITAVLTRRALRAARDAASR